MQKKRSLAVDAAMTALAAAAVAALILRRPHPYDFSGKTVLITGGSRGLGLELARTFAAAGAKIALCARDGAALERAARELSGTGTDVLTVVCDVKSRQEAETLINTVTQRFGAVDVLVNNAGIVTVGPASLMTRDDYEEAMATHFWAPLQLIEAVLPQMRARAAGRIVNIASVGGRVPVPHMAPYCASKHALTGLSETLRAELGGDGVIVTTATPGLMRTGSPRNGKFKGQHRREFAWFSIADSLPGLSVSARHAAAQIFDAVRFGKAVVSPSFLSRVAGTVHGVVPGLTAGAMGFLSRALLPKAGGIGTGAAAGAASVSVASPSLLTVLTERAALRNNELH